MSDAPTHATLELQLLVPISRESHQEGCLQEEVAELFEQWRGALLRYLSTFGLLEHDAEELVQEVFLCLFSHLHGKKARTNLRGWLFRVAHNLALKRRKVDVRTAGIRADVDTLTDPASNPEEQVATAQRQRLYLSILQALPEQDQRCLSLRAEGLQYREIADVLGVSLGTVASSLSRSVARFQRAMAR